MTSSRNPVSPQSVLVFIASLPLPNSVIDPSVPLPTTDCPSLKRTCRQNTSGRSKNLDSDVVKLNLDQQLGDADRVPDEIEPSSNG